MRLIDADALTKKLQHLWNIHDDVDFNNKDVWNELENAPTIDAVEVVRCKDCKYFDGECCDRYADETLGYSHSTQPNFFCAVGERKTDG